MDIKLDLKYHEDIPKIIHISWKNKNILDSNSDLIINGLANIKKILLLIQKIREHWED